MIENKKSKLLDKYPQLKKFYVYLDNKRLEKSKTRTIVNNIISACVIHIILLLLMLDNTITLSIGFAGIAFAIINIVSSAIPLFKKNNIPLHIAMIIAQAICIILYLVVLL